MDDHQLGVADEDDVAVGADAGRLVGGILRTLPQRSAVDVKFPNSSTGEDDRLAVGRPARLIGVAQQQSLGFVRFADVQVVVADEGQLAGRRPGWMASVAGQYGSLSTVG